MGIGNMVKGLHSNVLIMIKGVNHCIHMYMHAHVMHPYIHYTYMDCIMFSAWICYRKYQENKN